MESSKVVILTFPESTLWVVRFNWKTRMKSGSRDERKPRLNSRVNLFARAGAKGPWFSVRVARLILTGAKRIGCTPDVDELFEWKTLS